MPLPQDRIYTIDDIYALPDGTRAKLINGQSCDWHEDGFVILYDEECNIKELGTTDIIY